MPDLDGKKENQPSCEQGADLRTDEERLDEVFSYALSAFDWFDQFFK